MELPKKLTASEEVRDAIKFLNDPTLTIEVETYKRIQTVLTAIKAFDSLVDCCFRVVEDRNQQALDLLKREGEHKAAYNKLHTEFIKLQEQHQTEMQGAAKLKIELEQLAKKAVELEAQLMQVQR
jgi:hypothetical protein